MRRAGKALIAFFVLFSAFFTGFINTEKTFADNNYHVLTPANPLLQNWSDISMIDVPNIWTGVPSINGYSDNVTPDNVGVDPQLYLTDSTNLQVTPNKDRPGSFSTGGLAEFDRTPMTDFVVAMQGSAGHDYPNLNIRLDTTSCTAPANSIQVSYDLRDVDDSNDDTNQQVALHYRVGSTGDYTNIPEGYVADATTGPGLATLVTPVSVTLPAVTQGQSQVHLRIITSNATGSDEWVGVDNINISCAGSGSTAIQGTVNVGTGEAITSLTNPGGIFEQINSLGLSGNTIVNITSDLFAETGTVPLNQPLETGIGGYTLEFRAFGGPRVISGTSAAALIDINGADRVTFDGTVGGPNGLTIRNGGSGVTILMHNDASDNTVIGCIVEGQSSASGLIAVTTAALAGNNNIVIAENIIRDDTANPNRPFGLLEVTNSGAASRNTNIQIRDNTFSTFDAFGVSAISAADLDISGNTFTQLSIAVTEIISIQVVDVAGLTGISKNTITGQTTTDRFTGIDVQDSVSDVFSNRIDTSYGQSGTVGISVIGSKAPANVLLVNNMVSVGSPIPVPGQMVGIRYFTQSGIVGLYHNTVVIFGESTSDASWGFLKAYSGDVLMFSNILFSSRNASGNHFAVGDQGNPGYWESDHNLYVGIGPGQGLFFDLSNGTSSSGTPINFTDWRSAKVGNDTASIAGDFGSGPFNYANMFVSQDDLHLNTTGFNPAVNAGLDLGLPDDIDGDVRPLGGGVEIGADEVPGGTTAADVSVSGRILTANGQGIRGVAVTVMGGDLVEPKTFITGGFGYYSFEGLKANQTYVVTVKAKRYHFASDSKVIVPGEDIADFEFIALPN